MNEINVLKLELVNCLVENRDNHQKVYDEAMEGYRKAVIKALRKALIKAEEGRKIITYFNLERPESHIDDYDRALAMLNMSCDETIKLNAVQFDQYVRDIWSWSGSFSTTSSSYTSSSSRRI